MDRRRYYNDDGSFNDTVKSSQRRHIRFSFFQDLMFQRIYMCDVRSRLFTRIEDLPVWYRYKQHQDFYIHIRRLLELRYKKLTDYTNTDDLEKDLYSLLEDLEDRDFIHLRPAVSIYDDVDNVLHPPEPITVDNGATIELRTDYATENSINFLLEVFTEETQALNLSDLDSFLEYSDASYFQPLVEAEIVEHYTIVYDDVIPEHLKPNKEFAGRFALYHHKILQSRTTLNGSMYNICIFDPHRLLKLPTALFSSGSQLVRSSWYGCFMFSRISISYVLFGEPPRGFTYVVRDRRSLSYLLSSMIYKARYLKEPESADENFKILNYYFNKIIIN